MNERRPWTFAEAFLFGMCCGVFLFAMVLVLVRNLG